MSGTRKGKQDIEKWFRHFIEVVPTRTFRPLSVSVENIFDLVGNNVIAVQWEDPVNKAGEEFFVRGVTVSTVRSGKVTSATIYILDSDVLPRLWGEAPEVAEAMNASG